MYIKVITFFCAMLALGMFINVCDAQIDHEKIVGIWLLDEGKGNEVGDVSGNEKKGTAAQSNWVDGKVDGALSIKKGGTVTIPLGKGAILGKMSFILWLQFTDVGGQQNYFSIWDQGGNRYVPYKEGANILRFWTNNWNISSGVVVKAGTWYHVANVYDGNTAKIYVDGEEKISQAVPKFQLLDQDQTAWLATDKGDSFQSACIMDEVGLFNDALSKEEIQNIMEDGIHHSVLAVKPSDKLSVLWGKLKQ
ncbi:MAG: LamG domain-containing protein [Candidatus Poribacteria bacterium]|nr:LamG domain-containing protein [Candidatus Poribacteria bacterium]